VDEQAIATLEKAFAEILSACKEGKCDGVCAVTTSPKDSPGLVAVVAFDDPVAPWTMLGAIDALMNLVRIQMVEWRLRGELARAMAIAEANHHKAAGGQVQ